MNLEEVKTEFEQVFDQVNKLVSGVDADKINVKPSENKWSAAQVARHLIKANSGFPTLISGAGEETNREPDAMIERIRRDFADFGIKMEAADFLVPEEQVYEKDRLLKTLETIKSDISRAVENADMTKTYKKIEFPVYGYLTGLETLAFIVYHTKRHVHQLNKLYETI